MKFIKSIICTFLLSMALYQSSYADEGMWLPFLLDQLNIKDMQANGCKLSAKDIYDINNSSMKDGVMLFGGGCTGELISNNGLLLTNHHCGYGSVQALSSVEHDYFANGFWAMNKQEELPCKGLTVTFIVRMDDVTQQVLSQLSDTLSESQRDTRLKKIATFIEKNAVSGTHYTAQLKSFFNGNQFILIISETFKDIRLVGFPPNSIGAFGGDTDNWVWPRHTGDFSMFRIYANKENKPADYSADNVPYTPKYYFPISLKGVHEGDFTMVYGFPGQTREYLPSYGLQLVMNYQDPTRIAIREKRLNVWRDAMKKDKAVFIKYTSKEKGLSNAYKKWQGELAGLKANSAIEKKQQQEAAFKSWAQNKPAYAGLMNTFESAYTRYQSVSNAADYITEAALGVELISFAAQYNALIDSSFSTHLPDSLFQKQCAKLKYSADAFFKNYDVHVDREIAEVLLEMYKSAMLQSSQQQYIPALMQGDINKLVAKLFTKSVFIQQQKINELVTGSNRKAIGKLNSDVSVQLYKQLKQILDKEISPVSQQATATIARANRLYVKGILEMDANKLHYPDANSTLRVTYGKVQGMQAADAKYYKYYTTLDGLMEKEDSTNDEFIVSTKLRTLYQQKNYGKYAMPDGRLPVSFIASNHTTGGNSGSPVFNAKGELIGTNYDRVWEGTMSDLLYDVNRCRNITLDVRYTLFIIDKFAGAGYLLNEMKLID